MNWYEGEADNLAGKLRQKGNCMLLYFYNKALYNNK